MDTTPKLDAAAKCFPSILKVTLFIPFIVNLWTRFRFSVAVELGLGSTSHAENTGLFAGGIFASGWRDKGEVRDATFILFWKAHLLLRDCHPPDFLHPRGDQSLSRSLGWAVD